MLKPKQECRWCMSVYKDKEGRCSGCIETYDEWSGYYESSLLNILYKIDLLDYRG